MSIGFIYCATNQVNGKKYIGKTVNSDPVKYCKNHIKFAMSEYDIKKGKKKPFYRAIRKYSPNQFHWKILTTCNTIESLNECEKFFIQYFDTFATGGHGYNIANGGDGGNTRIGMSEKELKKYNEKISRATKKWTNTPEVRKFRSETQKKRIQENPEFGRFPRKAIENARLETIRLWKEEYEFMKSRMKKKHTIRFDNEIYDFIEKHPGCGIDRLVEEFGLHKTGLRNKMIDKVKENPKLKRLEVLACKWTKYHTTYPMYIFYMED